MSRKAILQPSVLVAAGDLSQASLTFPATDVTYLDSLSYLITWSGLSGGTGTLTVQGSNYDPAPLATQSFATLDFDPIAVTGSSGSALVNLGSLGFQKIQLVWAGNASAGTMKIVQMAKGTA